MHEQPSRQRILTITAAFAVTIICLFFFVTPVLQEIATTLREARTNLPCSISQQPPSRCEFPLVYNKPPKTAGTKIREDLANWSQTVNRRVYRCSPYTRQATFQMRECIPHDLDGCAIIANHMRLSTGMRNLLRSRIGDFRILTSTRNAADRIFSMFLQVTHTNPSIALRNTTILEDFISQFNPWDLYNYHTGEGREGSCPLSLQDVTVITDFVNSVDIVIDVDIRNVSNVILKDHNLFELSDSVRNRKTSSSANFSMFDSVTKDLVQSVSCVEEEMHRMFRLRMASMYQKATGTKCLSNTRFPVPTCF